jgi:hypothetical protein
MVGVGFLGLVVTPNGLDSGIVTHNPDKVFNDLKPAWLRQGCIKLRLS